jgi:FkbM family methyltransferase
MTAPQFNTLTQTKHGPLCVHRHDVYVGRALQLYGQFSEGEVALFARYLRPGMLVVDAGANVGAHTIPMARMVGGDAGTQGCVIAIEPQRLTYQCLTANAALNSLANVQTFHLALGAEEGTVRVPQLDLTKPNNVGGLGLGGHDGGAIVPQTTLDNLIAGPCHFIKIDVEGMERDVIAGAHHTIARERPVLYVENDRAQHSAGLIDDVRQLGYRLWWHRPPLFDPQNYKGVPENVFVIDGAIILSINMLCVPEERTPLFPTDLEEVT